MGHEVDPRKLSTAMTVHKAKNYANAYMLPITKKEAEARADGDWQQAIEAFKQSQQQFHNDSNEAKNAALYVDFKDERFSSPKDAMSEEMVAAITSLNSHFLSLVRAKVNLLSKWLSNLDEARETTQWFESRAEQLKSSGSSSPDEIMSILMHELRDRAKASRK